eukprot:8324875-Pyramimonas_sp.AAC.1
MEVRRTELQDERELLEAAPVEEVYTLPTHMNTDNRALATVADEQQGRLPTWNNPQSINAAETDHVPLCSADDDDIYGLDFDDPGRYVECVATMRAHVAAAPTSC